MFSKLRRISLCPIRFQPRCSCFVTRDLKLGGESVVLGGDVFTDAQDSTEAFRIGEADNEQLTERASTKNQSYSQGAKMAEFPGLGKHCSSESCKQLDFLPFDCDGCGRTFCVKHQAKDAHDCSKVLLQKSDVQYTGPHAYSCAVEGCSNRELTPITCEHCQLSVCLQHRHQRDHGCRELKEQATPNIQTAEHVSQVLASKQSKPAKKKNLSAKSQKMAAQIALMKLKGKAEGDKGLPDSERVYFSVAMPKASAQTAKPLFVSKVWTVGRIIDFIADRCGINNPNNTGASHKLRLFIGDTGELIPVDKKLSELLDTDSSLYNGSFIVLESVPQDLTCLPDVNDYHP